MAFGAVKFAKRDLQKRKSLKHVIYDETSSMGSDVTYAWRTPDRVVRSAIA
ncbi:MAG: hypothetical protein JO134_13435 [Xanthobacteraceae bacterium]|nr:hypothetical protein [Xanthobacteraceae bacterium]